MSNVSHPKHYNSGKIEVIEAIEDWKLNYQRGNAVKYIARAGKKDPAKEIEDLEKARWYLNREIENLTAAKEGREPKRPNEMNPRQMDLPLPDLTTEFPVPGAMRMEETPTEYAARLRQESSSAIAASTSPIAASQRDFVAGEDACLHGCRRDPHRFLIPGVPCCGCAERFA